MLSQLIDITNSVDFVERGELEIVEVLARPKEDKSVQILIKVSLEDKHTFEISTQLWQINCLNVSWNFNNAVRDIYRPYNQIQVYSTHPILWNYEGVYAEVYIYGKPTNIPSLMGELYLAHDKACGHWVDFSQTCFHLPENFIRAKEVVIGLPNCLLESYLEVLKKFNLAYSIQTYPDHFSDKKKSALIIGNPAVCPDNYYLGQPHLVAQIFDEKLLE